MKRCAAALAAATMATASSATAAAPELKPELVGVGFLVGDWSNGNGEVKDAAQRASGSSRVEIAAGGAVLLRRDRTELTDTSGKSAGAFEQVMMIYPEGGTLHADYSDGVHVIHYVSAQVSPGRSVVFSSVAAEGAPTFRLGYTLADATTLKVSFSMAPPGTQAFHPIAEGVLTRRR